MKKVILSIFLVSLTNFCLGCKNSNQCVAKAKCKIDPHFPDDGDCVPINKSCTTSNSSNCPDGYSCQGMEGSDKKLHYSCLQKKCQSNSDCGKGKCAGMGLHKFCYAEKPTLVLEETQLIQDSFEESEDYSGYTMIMAGLFGLVVGAVTMKLMNMRQMAKPERYSEINRIVEMQN